MLTLRRRPSVTVAALAVIALLVLDRALSLRSPLCSTPLPIQARSASAAASSVFSANAAGTLPVIADSEEALPPFFDQSVVSRRLRDFALFSRLQRASRRISRGKPRGHSLPFITGDAFRMSADLVVDDEYDLRAYKRDSLTSEALCAGFARTGVAALALDAGEALVLFYQSDVPNATQCVRELAPTPVVLIMHNSDMDVPGEVSAAAGLLELPNLVHLFAENCDRAHDKITCIPTGLENRWLGPQVPSHHRGYHGEFPELMFGFISSLVPAHPAAAVAAAWTPEPTGSAVTDHMLWAMFDRSTDAFTAKPVRTDLHAMMMERAVRDPEAARHVRLWGESRPVHQLYRKSRWGK
jgi:hypothetical protein